MIEQAMLIEYAAEYGICVTPAQAQRFAVYAELLVDWNQRINLTAITAPHEIVLKHFVDSLTALTVLPPRTGEPLSLIDVGTGAGFPGVPLAILRDDIQLTLLDSLNKRLVFLRELCAAVEVPVTLLHARAEEGGANRSCGNALTWRPPARWRRCRHCVSIACPSSRWADGLSP